MAVHPQRLRQAGHQRLGDGQGGRLVARRGEQDGELVAGQPRHQGVRGDRRPQAPGYQAQDLVAGWMAVGLVDDLEAVEVADDEHRPRPG